jgi:hypothetical protein
MTDRRKQPLRLRLLPFHTPTQILTQTWRTSRDFASVINTLGTFFPTTRLSIACLQSRDFLDK